MKACIIDERVPHVGARLMPLTVSTHGQTVHLFHTARHRSPRGGPHGCWSATAVNKPIVTTAVRIADPHRKTGGAGKLIGAARTARSAAIARSNGWRYAASR